MSIVTYQHCYRVLNVASDCDWDAVRLAYRRRVRDCHPDRVAASRHASGPGRDSEFKEVVLAYRLLARFYSRYGEMPPPWLGVDADAGRSRGRTARDRHETASRSWTATRERSRPTLRWLPAPFHAAVFAVFVSGVCAAAIVDRFHEKPNQDAPVRNGELVVGMNPQTVVDIQGLPTHTKGSVWFYGESGVIFDQGCVVGWENQSPFPLRTLVSMTYLDTRAPARDCR